MTFSPAACAFGSAPAPRHSPRRGGACRVGSLRTVDPLRSSPASSTASAQRAANKIPALVCSAKPKQEKAPDPSTRAPYPNLINQLLQRAASRLQRGENIHCIHCKGEGVVCCPVCECTGVLKPESVKVNQMERAIKSVKATVASMRGEQGDPFDFKLSNRCRACHGTGTQECIHCRGTGRRN